MYRDDDLRRAVASLLCVRCGGHLVQAANSNLPQHGKGKSLKASDAAIMALCTECHQDLDQGSGMTREERQAMTFECIAATYIQLMELGHLRIADAAPRAGRR